MPFILNPVPLCRYLNSTGGRSFRTPLQPRVAQETSKKTAVGGPFKTKKPNSNTEESSTNCPTKTSTLNPQHPSTLTLGNLSYLPVNCSQGARVNPTTDPRAG